MEWRPEGEALELVGDGWTVLPGRAGQGRLEEIVLACLPGLRRDGWEGAWSWRWWYKRRELERSEGEVEVDVGVGQKGELNLEEADL